MHKAKEICKQSRYDAVVVGSGPNGMACAITLARKGLSVLVVEAQPLAGGGCRTMELTLPEFKNDVCSSVQPLGFGSPIFRTMPLEQFGLRWINPEGAYVQAVEPERAIVVWRDFERTADQLGKGYRKLFRGMIPDWNELCDVLLHPQKIFLHPFCTANFGLRAIRSIENLAGHYLKEGDARAAYSGVAAHATLPFNYLASASIGFALAIAAHAIGWAVPQGGAQSIANSLISYFESLGGEIVVDAPVRSLQDLPDYKLLFLDITPKQFARIAEDALPQAYLQKIPKFKYGPAVFKLDWALSKPIPWNAPDCAAAATVHVGGSFEDVARAEAAAWGEAPAPAHPYVLLTQPSLFDSTRAPEGKHTAWAYCHLPLGATDDMTEAIEAQIERHAHGFRDSILARSVMPPARLEEMNENHIGGDIQGGSLHMPQLLARPFAQAIPYATPLPNVFLCSSSTPPGAGVHGMCGYYAAICALTQKRNEMVRISSGAQL